MPLRDFSCGCGKRSAAQALQIPRAGPSVSLPGRLQVYQKAAVIVTVIQIYSGDYAALVEIKVAGFNFAALQHEGRPGPQGNQRVRGEQLLKIIQGHKGGLLLRRNAIICHSGIIRQLFIGDIYGELHTEHLIVIRCADLIGVPVRMQPCKNVLQRGRCCGVG